MQSKLCIVGIFLVLASVNRLAPIQRATQLSTRVTIVAKKLESSTVLKQEYKLTANIHKCKKATSCSVNLTDPKFLNLNWYVNHVLFNILLCHRINTSSAISMLLSGVVHFKAPHNPKGTTHV